MQITKDANVFPHTPFIVWDEEGEIYALFSSLIHAFRCVNGVSK